MAKRDYYEVLGVDRTADDGKLKSAYRKLAKKYHPDANPGDKEAEQKFKEVGEAYAILSDPEKRKLYDAYGFAAFEGPDPSQYQGGRADSAYHYGGGPGGFSSFHFSGEDAENLFESMFGDLFGHHRGSGSGAGSAFGGASGFRGTSGFGRTSGFGSFGDGTFGSFGGTGRTEDLNLRTSLTIGFREAALGCKKTIRLEKPDGTGQQTLEIGIPAGIDEGQSVRLRGKGRISASGRSGDLLIEIRIAPDGAFTRDGLDLHTSAEIPFTTAALGGEAQLPTLSGSVSCRIPAGIQSGKQLRLKGKGIAKGGRCGDEYVEIRIAVPRHLTEQERSLLLQLEALQRDGARKNAS